MKQRAAVGGVAEDSDDDTAPQNGFYDILNKICEEAGYDSDKSKKGCGSEHCKDANPRTYSMTNLKNVKQISITSMRSMMVKFNCFNQLHPTDFAKILQAVGGQIKVCKSVV